MHILLIFFLYSNIFQLIQRAERSNVFVKRRKETSGAVLDVVEPNEESSDAQVDLEDENLSLATLGREIRTALTCNAEDVQEIPFSTCTWASTQEVQSCYNNNSQLTTSNTCTYTCTSTRIAQGFPGQESALSKQGQAVMDTLNPYLRNFTIELQKFLTNQEKHENPLESKLIAEVDEMKDSLQKIQNDITKNRSLLHQILDILSNSQLEIPSSSHNVNDFSQISTSQSIENQEILDLDPFMFSSPPAPNLSIRITKKLDFNTPSQLDISNKTPQIKVQDINPFCNVLRNISIAGIIPPKAFEELSYEEKVGIKRQSKSDLNFAVNLIRVAIPANRRYKMSCTGRSKHDLGHCKDPLPTELITKVIEIVREMWGHGHNPKEFTEAIDSDCKQLFSKAKECRVKKICSVCRQDPSLPINFEDSLSLNS